MKSLLNTVKVTTKDSIGTRTPINKLGEVLVQGEPVRIQYRQAPNKLHCLKL